MMVVGSSPDHSTTTSTADHLGRRRSCYSDMLLLLLLLLRNWLRLFGFFISKTPQYPLSCLRIFLLALFQRLLLGFLLLELCRRLGIGR